jgi:hypothetical protein
MWTCRLNLTRPISFYPCPFYAPWILVEVPRVAHKEEGQYGNGSIMRFWRENQKHGGTIRPVANMLCFQSS